MRKESLRLLAMAQRDLRALRGMSANTSAFADEIVGFHAQQAVEKATKAWLCSMGVIFPKTHDISELFAVVEEQGVAMPTAFLDLVDLVDFAVQYRYDAYEDLPIDRAATEASVSAFLQHVQAQFPA